VPWEQVKKELDLKWATRRLSGARGIFEQLKPLITWTSVF